MSEVATATVNVSIDTSLAPEQAFDVFAEELTTALAQAGIRFEAGEQGTVSQSEFEVGRVILWRPGEIARWVWHPADWHPGEVTEVELRVEAHAGGSRITLQQLGWGGQIGAPDELVGWFAGKVAAPLLHATSPEGLATWLTDRRAGRPTGARSRSVYRDPLYHYPNFYVILDELKLSSSDYLLEVGCGGGAFLHMALDTGCRAAAVDHSVDMVQLARQVNQTDIAAGRLDIQLASADHLPFPDATFSAAVMTGVLGFLPDPVAVFAEIRRVLGPGGRLVALGSDPQLRGTPAAPEPLASYLHFYTDEEHGRIVHEAGFEEVKVVRRDMESFARKAGIPEEDAALFSGPGGPFLLARKRQ